ncbi:ABC transporter ATP-binding protein [Nonomuraea sp. NPDC050540]|uniref:ABC transporter ATP-binding protein n=1 Tax=Nonomuraea sp. NPDC050540 TaxID=3364367 RepID=UPI0037A37146
MPDQPVLADLPDQRAVFRRAAVFLRGHRLALAAVVALNLTGAALAVGVTAAIGRVIDAAGGGRAGALALWSGALLVLVAAGGALAWSSRYWLVRVGEHALAGLRERAVSALGTAPLRFVEANRRGELLRRVTGEINGLGSFAGATLPDLVTGAAVLVFTVVMLAAYSWLLTVVMLVAFVPPAVLIVRRFKARAGVAYGAVAAAEATVAARFAESLPAQEQLRVNGAVPRWLARFGADNDRLLDTQAAQVRAELELNRLALLQAACVAVVLALSAWLVGRDLLSVGVAVVFVLATRDIFHRFEDLAASIGEAREAHVRLARVLDLIEASAPTGGADDGGDLPARGELTLSGVGFSYGGARPAVDGLSLTVAAGDRLVIAGRTGSGKSTVGKLMAGLYTPGTGAVRFAGHDLAAVDPARVRARVVLVPQDVLLVDGTLAENLAMLPVPPDRRRVEAALRELGLAGWVAALPDGLDTRVGTHGSRLSAGERQLVAIVRAALADPAVLILDEATAEVDHETAAMIEGALSAAAGDRTLIVIAHRAGTIARGRRLLSMPAGLVTVPGEGVSLRRPPWPGSE